jgi:hypothetical protein
MPGGRPIGSQNKDKRFRAAIIRQLELHPDLLDQIAARLCAAAASGDGGAMKEFGDRVDGKVPQAIVGDDDHPPVGMIVTGVIRDGDGSDNPA